MGKEALAGIPEKHSPGSLTDVAGGQRDFQGVLSPRGCAAEAAQGPCFPQGCFPWLCAWGSSEISLITGCLQQAASPGVVAEGLTPSHPPFQRGQFLLERCTGLETACRAVGVLKGGSSGADLVHDRAGELLSCLFQGQVREMGDSYELG